MRFFSSRKNEVPRWVDAGVLGWTPEEPLNFEPPQKPGNDAGKSGEWRPEPRVVPLVAPVETPVEKIAEHEPALTNDWRDLPRVIPERELIEPRREPAPPKQPIPLENDAGWSGEWNAEPRAEPAPRTAEPEFKFSDPPLAANSDRAPNWLALRLTTGLLQGIALYLLFSARDHGAWPGSDPMLFTALLFAVAIAPLALLEGLGEVEPKLLLLWSGTLGFLVATLGLWQAWRGGPSFAGVAIIALLALIIHVAVRAGLRDRQPLPHYRTWFEISWTLGARLLVWSAITALAFLVIGSGNSLLHWLKAHHAAVEFRMQPTFLNLPLLGLASAAAFALTAHGRVRAHARAALLTCATVALPLLIGTGLVVLGVHLFGRAVSAGHLLGLAVLLLLAFNACYREGAREPWRKYGEYAAGFVILALAMAAAGALHVRIVTEGWTDMRIYGVVAAAMLTLYGLGYAGAALISSGGAPWMKVVEYANPLLAIVLALACLALSTPLFDPLSVAVKSQVAALRNPEQFDFAWLRQGGGRFGDEALARLIRSPDADVARAASRAKILPAIATPTPSEIGANITLHTASRLPQALLAQDWGNTKVPPCLTRAGLGCDAWFLDLNGDGRQEILLVHGDDTRFWASVMQLEQGHWKAAASLASPPCPGLLSRMRARGLLLANPVPQWRDVLVAGMRLTPVSPPPAELPCPR
jgi:hypothetical protein